MQTKWLIIFQTENLQFEIKEYCDENEFINDLIKIEETSDYFKNLRSFKVEQFNLESNKIYFQYKSNELQSIQLTNQLYDLEFELEKKISNLSELENIEPLNNLTSVNETDIYQLKNEITKLYDKIQNIELELKDLQRVKLELFCPKCNLQHIDRNEWVIKLHKTHLCEQCGNEWKPFDFPTTGV